MCIWALKMDRYHKVEKPRAEQPIDENEIRITSQGRMRNYITYAIGLLQVFYFSQIKKFLPNGYIELLALIDYACACI